MKDSSAIDGSPLVDKSDNQAQNKFAMEMPDKMMFLKKTLFIVAATYLFVPLIALHNKGDVSTVLYASILVGLHIVFIIVYFWRVKVNELDEDRRSLYARVLGLLACLYLLYMVAGNLEDDLGKLAVELLGLCAVHTLILALLMTKCGNPASSEAEQCAIPENEHENP
jgi:hypothetical protein